MSGAERIRASFASAAGEGRTALIAYILSGYPSDADALAAAEAALAAGADMLEIGVPFSDPMAEGRPSPRPAVSRWRRAAGWRRRAGLCPRFARAATTSR